MGNVVLTMGGFDLFHVGHLSLLKACQKIAGEDGIVYIGVNTDEFMSSYKRTPFIPFKERCRIVSGVLPDAIIFPVDEHDSSKVIDRAINLSGRVDFLVIGDDWAKKDYHYQIGQTKEDLKAKGITLLYKSIDEEVTTTKIIERIKKN